VVILLKDALGNEMLSGDIVKRERIVDAKKETSYFIFDMNSFNKYFLFQYDSNGQINESSFSNIRVDDSVTLVNDDSIKWIRLGRKEEMYKILYK
jgi:hypothetical protein